MKKILTLSFLSLLYFCYPCFADTRSSAMALEWWLKDQGKVKGSTVCTKDASEGSNRCVITDWKVPGVPKPTEALIVQIIDYYDSFLIINKITDGTRKTEVMTKFGLTDDDVEVLKKLLKD